MILDNRSSIRLFD